MTTQSANQTPALTHYTHVPYATRIDPEAITRALMAGDISKLSPQDRVQFYAALCQSAGLNVLSRPFILLKTQNNELHWYPTVGCAEQLRKLHRVSTRVLSRERTEDGLFIVTVQASTPDGRTEESQGIEFIGALKGQALGNAMMKAGSKALRRVTLSLIGLGMAGAEEESGQVIAFDPQSGTVELPPAPEEPGMLLTVIGRWFRDRPKDAREVIAMSVWECPLREIPHLGEEDLVRGWRTIDEGAAAVDWTSDTLAEALTQWRTGHAQRAVLDIFDRSDGRPAEDA